MSLDRVAGPSFAGVPRGGQSLWRVVAILLPLLFSQALPEPAMSLGTGSTAAWENAEDNAGDNLDHGYRATTIGDSCAKPVPARLAEAGAIVARPAASRLMSRRVAPSPRGPPEYGRDAKNHLSSNGRAPPSVSSS